MPSTHTAKSRSQKTGTGATAPPVVENPETAQPASETTQALTMSETEKREVLIRLAAYSFYERRGYVSGHELEDWLQAEMEVNRQMAKPPGPDLPN